MAGDKDFVHPYLEEMLDEWHLDDGDMFIVNNRDITDATIVSSMVMRDVKSGMSAESISGNHYSESLKTTLQHLKVPNRSMATSKIEMAMLLIRWYKGTGHGNYIQSRLDRLTRQSPVTLRKLLERLGYDV